MLQLFFFTTWLKIMFGADILQFSVKLCKYIKFQNKLRSERIALAWVKYCNSAWGRPSFDSVADSVNKKTLDGALKASQRKEGESGQI